MRPVARRSGRTAARKSRGEPDDLDADRALSMLTNPDADQSSRGRCEGSLQGRLRMTRQTATATRVHPTGEEDRLKIDHA
jgi:hypothetical protein